MAKAGWTMSELATLYAAVYTRASADADPPGPLSDRETRDQHKHEVGLAAVDAFGRYLASGQIDLASVAPMRADADDPVS